MSIVFFVILGLFVATVCAEVRCKYSEIMGTAQVFRVFFLIYCDFLLNFAAA